MPLDKTYCFRVMAVPKKPKIKLNNIRLPTLTGNYNIDSGLWQLSLLLRSIAESLEGGDEDENINDPLASIPLERRNIEKGVIKQCRR